MLSKLSIPAARKIQNAGQFLPGSTPPGAVEILCMILKWWESANYTPV